jgi:hypothetical protein
MFYFDWLFAPVFDSLLVDAETAARPEPRCPASYPGEETRKIEKGEEMYEANTPAYRTAL